MKLPYVIGADRCQMHPFDIHIGNGLQSDRTGDTAIGIVVVFKVKRGSFGELIGDMDFQQMLSGRDIGYDSLKRRIGIIMMCDRRAVQIDIGRMAYTLKSQTDIAASPDLAAVNGLTAVTAITGIGLPTAGDGRHQRGPSGYRKSPQAAELFLRPDRMCSKGTDHNKASYYIDNFSILYFLRPVKRRKKSIQKRKVVL